jgi:pimeloyl-ACP methyl ester carboxylesterase
VISNGGVGGRRRAFDGVVESSPRLAFREWPGTGQSFLLLHGLTHNLEVWARLAELLPDNAHIVAFDMRSHGASDNAPGQHYDDYASDVRRVIADRDMDRPMIVGHSWGARVALYVAATDPTLPRSVVALDQALWSHTCPAPTASEESLTETLVAEAEHAALIDHYETEWPEWAPLVRRQYRRAESGWVPTFRAVDHVRLVAAEVTAQPVEPFYERITCPVMLVFARDEAEDFGFAPPRGRHENVDHLARADRRLRIEWNAQLPHRQRRRVVGSPRRLRGWRLARDVEGEEFVGDGVPGEGLHRGVGCIERAEIPRGAHGFGEGRLVRADDNPV